MTTALVRAGVTAQVEASVLKQALDLVKPAVASRQFVRLDAIAAGVLVTAANGDLAVRTVASAVVSGRGSVAVRYALARDLLTRRAGPVRLAFGDGDDLCFDAARVRGRLKTAETSEVPAVPPSSFDGDAHPIDTDAVRRVLSAVGTDPGRPALTGVLFDGAHMVATDSYRLHLEHLGQRRRLRRCLVPGSALASILAARHPHLLMRLNDGTRYAQVLAVEPAPVEYVVRLLPSEFPDWRRLIPPFGSTPGFATLEVREIAAAIAAVRPVVSDGHHVRLDVLSDRVAVTATSAAGCVTAEVRAEVQGEKLSATFDARYLTASLTSGTSKAVSVHLQDRLKPAVITDAGCDWSKGAYGVRLVMPVRV